MNTDKTIIKEREKMDKFLNKMREKIEKILAFLKKHPEKYFGAGAIDRELGFDRGYNSWPTHGLLLELKKEGILEQKENSGFRIKREEILEQQHSSGLETQKTEKILAFLKKHPEKYFGAGDIDRELGFDRGHNNWPTHGLLSKLRDKGILEQKSGSGFKIKREEVLEQKHDSRLKRKQFFDKQQDSRLKRERILEQHNPGLEIKRYGMTYKQRFVSLFLFILLICSGGLGWNLFLKSNDCNHFNYDIKRLMDNQSNLLLTYGLFAEHSLTKDAQKSFKKMIDLKEPLIRSKIESFQKMCRSRLRTTQVKTLFKSFEMYVVTKQKVFKESQWVSLNWLRKNIPVDPSAYDID